MRASNSSGNFLASTPQKVDASLHTPWIFSPLKAPHQSLSRILGVDFLKSPHNGHFWPFLRAFQKSTLRMQVKGWSRAFRSAKSPQNWDWGVDFLIWPNFGQKSRPSAPDFGNFSLLDFIVKDLRGVILPEFVAKRLSCRKTYIAQLLMQRGVDFLAGPHKKGPQKWPFQKVHPSNAM